MPSWALTADEFVFARHIYDYTRALPYRDFAPYKSILGYYLLSIPFYFSHATLEPLFYIKDEIILINALCIAATCLLSLRLYHKNAILLSMLAVMANASFMIYAADLRVDMLTSWCCLLAILFFLRQQTAVSGVLLGIAFLISQKALWYFIAIDGALLACYYLYRSNTFSLHRFILFNAAVISPILLYIAIWSTQSSLSRVLDSLFYEAYIQAGIQWYTPIYLACWQLVLHYGPALFLCWPLTFISLTQDKNQPALQQRVFITFLTSLFLLQFINYKQAFPYNFVFTVPAFYLIYATFFSWLLTVRNKQWLTASIKLTSIALFTLYGIIYPFYLSLMHATQVDGTYQQQMISLADSLLDSNSSYIGGIPYFYNKDQPINGLKNLIGPELDYISEAKPELKPLLLDSLYLADATQTQIIRDFETMPVKVIMNNYRIHYLPPAILNYINQHYYPYNGSIYLYAPIVHANQKQFLLKFDGKYQIQSENVSRIMIDGKWRNMGEINQLNKGIHTTSNSADYRLTLVPQIAAQTTKQPDEWLRMLKAILS